MRSRCRRARSCGRRRGDGTRARAAARCCLRRTRLPVAPQARVGLPERHRAVVVVGLLRCEVAPCCRDEILLRRAGLDAPRPVGEPLPQLGEVPLTSSATPKWISASRSGSRRSISLERSVPGLDVDVGRRRRRQDAPVRLDPHAGRVAGVQRLAVEVADVVRRVARGSGSTRGRAPARRRRWMFARGPARARPRARRRRRRRAAARCARAGRGRRGAARRSRRRDL